MRKAIVTLLVVFFVSYAILLGLMFTYQRSLMYFPQPALGDEARDKILSEESFPVHVTTADGIEIRGFFTPPKADKRTIMLAFHGNGSLAEYLSQNFEWAMNEGYGVFLAEYRGYGGNMGQPTEIGLYQDADAYLAYLKEHFPDYRLVAYGQSLGSAVAIDLVSRQPDLFAGLILEAPFSSAVQVADTVYPYILFKKWIMRDQYLSDQKIQKITVPKLFLLAEQDDVVGLQTGIDLFDKSPDPKTIRVYHEARHATIFSYDAPIDMLDFLNSLGQDEQP